MAQCQWETHGTHRATATAARGTCLCANQNLRLATVHSRQHEHMSSRAVIRHVRSFTGSHAGSCDDFRKSRCDVRDVQVELGSRRLRGVAERRPNTIELIHSSGHHEGNGANGDGLRKTVHIRDDQMSVVFLERRARKSRDGKIHTSRSHSSFSPSANSSTVPSSGSTSFSTKCKHASKVDGSETTISALRASAVYETARFPNAAAGALMWIGSSSNCHCSSPLVTSQSTQTFTSPRAPTDHQHVSEWVRAGALNIKTGSIAYVFEELVLHCVSDVELEHHVAGEDVCCALYNVSTK